MIKCSVDAKRLLKLVEEAKNKLGQMSRIKM